MNLFETLQRFKNISPEPAFKERSKREILAALPSRRFPAAGNLRLGQILAHIFEGGIAVALTVFFILIIAGQFSNAPYVSPIQLSVINPQTLKAEAQAVDIQIQLASVAYREPTSTMATTNETTPQVAATGTAGVKPGFTAAALQAAGGASTTSATASSTATSTTVSVDDALKALSQ